MKPISCVLAALILSCSITDCDAFVKSSLLCHNVGRGTMVGYKEATTARSFREEKPDHFLLDEFKTYDGQVVNPYQTLRVGREADRSEVRKAYIKLSRRYHPDGFRQKDILPGRCNNLEEVREEWERIKLSYEILSDRKTRRRYDRHYMIAKPGEAIGRAAMGAVGKGMGAMGKGLFDMGAMAVQKMTEKKQGK